MSVSLEIANVSITHIQGRFDVLCLVSMKAVGVLPRSYIPYIYVIPENSFNTKIEDT